MNIRKYRRSHTEGCAEGFFFLPVAETPLIQRRRVRRLDGLAYSHNEKPCPVTIDKTIRYEGVQIVICNNYRRNRLTFLVFRVMYRTQVNNKKQSEITENLLKTEPKSAII